MQYTLYKITCQTAICNITCTKYEDQFWGRYSYKYSNNITKSLGHLQGHISVVL
nr:MAG TPA: hypothetical protein [Caudoviricetes sp.]